MRVVILSGGSEIVATSLVEDFLEAGIPIALVSLGGNSMLCDVAPDILYSELTWPPADPENSAEVLHNVLVTWGATENNPWPIFATEDGGLRLLLEYRQVIYGVARFGFARRLVAYGGLDKAELFTFLAANGCQELIAPTIDVHSPDRIGQAIKELGNDCVIKPSIKPFSMQLTGMPAKAFMSRDYLDQKTLVDTLRLAWTVSINWVVQRRLENSPEGEVVFWAARDSQGELVGMAAVEKWKQPKSGGTGCWVITRNNLIDQLTPIAKKILECIDFVGICELPFLLDDHGKWKLLELNPRPWLQIGLAKASGVPLARMAQKIVMGGAVTMTYPENGVSWINVERLLLAALLSERGGKWQALKQATKALYNADTVAIYGSKLPHVRRRWLFRMARTLLARLS